MPDELFDVLAFGCFPSERTQILETSRPRPTSDIIESAIETAWSRQVDEARCNGRLLFNGDLLRYVGHRVDARDDGPKLLLEVGPTCYRDFVGTNLFNHHRLAEFGWDRFANPIGTTATLLTRDGRIVYGRRSDRVAYHAGHVHTFGGALGPGDRGVDGRIDAFGSVARELEEEVGLQPSDFEPLICVGIVRDCEIRQPEMLFETRAHLDSAELVRRWENATARDEHSDLVWLENDPAAIVPFVRSCGLIAPVAVAGLMLHARQVWGEDWYLATVRQL